MTGKYLEVEQDGGIVKTRLPLARAIGFSLLPLSVILTIYLGLWIEETDLAQAAESPGELIEVLLAEPDPLLLILFALIFLNPLFVFIFSRWCSFETTFDLENRQIRSRRRRDLSFDSVKSLIYVPPYFGNLPAVSLAVDDAQPRLLFLSWRKEEARHFAKELASATGLPLDLEGMHSTSRADANWPLRIILALVTLAGVVGAGVLAAERIGRGDILEGIAVGFFLLALATLVGRVAWIQWQPAGQRPEMVFGPWVYYGFAILVLMAASVMIWQDYRALTKVDETGWWQFALGQIGDVKILLLVGMAYAFWLTGRRTAKKEREASRG